MGDLRFMIVNSNLQHAQQTIRELKKRVSFDVHQDTQEDNIWGRLQGGKDDIFVYDRCGRLAYYVPFPLSIMTHKEGDLVISAILATYYRSPCGISCVKNSLTLEDYLNSYSRSIDATTEKISTTESYANVLTTQTENALDLKITRSPLVEERLEYNVNQSEHSGFDYPSYDETLDEFENNETNPVHDRAFFNSLYSFFINSDNAEFPEEVNINETISNNTSFTEYAENVTYTTFLNVSEDGILESLNNATVTEEVEVVTSKPEPLVTSRPKPDRCAEADPSVCRNWSKKRLLRAYDCCSNLDVNDGSRDHLLRYCRNFGRKRCKKIKTILKCCIKTSLYQPTTPNVEEPSTTPTAEETSTTQTSEELATAVQMVAEERPSVVCCKSAEEGLLCRISENRTCHPEEYVQQDSSVVEAAPLVERTM